MKYCAKCKKLKPFSEYNKKSSRPDGLQERCRDCFREYNSQRYKEKKDFLTAQINAYVERKGGYSAVYESRREYYQKRYQENKETILLKQREYERANPHVRAGINARRRATTKKMTALDKRKSHLHRLRIANDLCYYCGGCTPEMHYDHVYPISKGGTDHWFNLVRACEPCNKSKSARLMSAVTV